MRDTIWRPDLTRFDGPKYLGLAHALRASIRSGELAQGTRLPPVRDLAWDLGMTPGTVARAYQIATQEGLLEAAVGRGTFVAARSPQLGPSQPLFVDRAPENGTGPVDLRSPQLPDVGQAAAIGTILREIADNVGRDYLDYPNLRRDRPVRVALVDWLADRLLGPIGPEDIALAHGGQNAINLVMQCCLRGERPQIFCEELAYPGFRHAARLNRAEVVAVALDGQGMRADALAAACRKSGARLVCLTPDAQNPTTARMGMQRRAEIVAVARAHDLQILEDDCYSVARAEIPAFRQLAPERTWHVTSLSKSISAGLRFGAVVCPTGRGEAGRLAAQHSFFGLARPVTDIVLGLLASGQATQLRQGVQEVLARRLAIAVETLRGADVSWQDGLSFLWLRLPTGWRGSTFAREAEASGVLVRSADEYALVDGRAPNAVRIALALGIAEDRFAAAMATLARLLVNPPGDLPV